MTARIGGLVMRIMLRAIVSLGLSGALMLVAAPAFAANATADYGQHVRHCAQHHGFNGEHHPGTHQGKSGWDPTHVC